MAHEQTGCGPALAQDVTVPMARRRWPRLAWIDNFRGTPDRAVAKQRYARLAAHYEGSTGRIRAVRERTIAQLHLQPGQTVFDVACGSGAALMALSEAVGPTGRVIGIEQSPEMATLARRAASGMPNIEVLCESAARFRSPVPADAVLCCYTHDVLQDPASLNNLFAQARPGAPVAVSGLCMAPWWLAPANAWVLWGARMYLTTWRGLRRPWTRLLKHCPDLRICSRHHGLTGYVAAGRFDGTRNQGPSAMDMHKDD